MRCARIADFARGLVVQGKYRRVRTLTMSPERSLSPPASDLSPEEVAQLQDTLKRCSPETFAAACQFHRTRDRAHLGPLVHGVIERYVERDLRAKLNTEGDSLRLVEDLGLDSLSLMEIVVLAEDVLKISVSNEELTKLRTVGDVRQFIVAKVGAGL